MKIWKFCNTLCLLGLLFLPQVGTGAVIPSVLEEMIARQPALPRYAEEGYSPLGRSPIVDMLLEDPFYLPVYGLTTSNTLKQVSQRNSLYELYTQTLLSGGVPFLSSAQPRKFCVVGLARKLPRLRDRKWAHIDLILAHLRSLNPGALAPPNHAKFSWLGTKQIELCSIKNIPDRFTTSFGPMLGSEIYRLWQAFRQIRSEVIAALAPLSPKEKEWLRLHYTDFFFGENGHDYDFFTTPSPMPLKFFTLAARIDLAELAECARKLSLLVDRVYQQRHIFSNVSLAEDFIWEEEGVKLLISSKEGAVFTESVDFFLGLGAQNSYQQNSGGTEGERPLALHIDLKGSHSYRGRDFVQGAGFLGVGLLATFEGHNHYIARSYAQGAGFFGAGLLMNLGGKNHFHIDFAGQSCALFGSSLLWVKGGHNCYLAHDGLAQAASSTQGVAFLIDNGGHNSYLSGVPGKNGSRQSGMGQGAAIGVRGYPWTSQPSFYGGLSFLYNQGGYNIFKTSWYGQGSAYFLSAGILAVEGDANQFLADVDSQGQGLHLAAGLLLVKGSQNLFSGGWGSLGVGGDRSVGMLIDIGGENRYMGTDQSIGTARKPKALGLFINIEGHNSYTFQKLSNANLQKPASPLEWPTALFLTFGGGNRYVHPVDGLSRGPKKPWGLFPHSMGIDSARPLNLGQLFAALPPSPRTAHPLYPNSAYRPLSPPKDREALQKLVQEMATADYSHRRQLYESLDLLRFTNPSFDLDLSPLLKDPAVIPEDLFNYAALWAMQHPQQAPLEAVITTLRTSAIPSAYSRKMAIKLIGTKSPSTLAYVIDCDLSVENRATAAYYLAQTGTPEALNLLEKAMHSPDETVRFAAASGLQQSPAPALCLLTPLFEDSSFYVRRAAALSAISLHDKAAIPILLETLQYDTLDTEENYGDNIYHTLSLYLGVDFGLDKKAWISWWEKNQESFEFLPSF